MSERMDLSDVRREIEKRLAELEPSSPEADAAKPAFGREAQGLQIQLRVLGLFERVDRELGQRARLEVIRHDPPSPAMSVRLSPTNPRAARVEAYPLGDDTVYLGMGLAGWIETWAGRGEVDAFLEMLEEHVRAVIQGDIEEVYWLPEGASEEDVTSSKLYVVLRGKRRRVGALGVIRPLRKAAKVHRRYEAY